MKRTTLALAVTVVVNMTMFATIPAHAAKKPRPLITDQRMKQIAYDPNQVYEIVSTYGYQTTIEFAPDEHIKGRLMGDTIAWQTMIKGNHVFIKPAEPNAETNMTIITNKRTYFFQLKSSVKKSDNTFLVRFKYPNDANDFGAGGTQSRPVERVAKGFDPASLNLNYSSAGDKKSIQLKRVFDDGEFTYFQFDKNTEIPSFYIVGNDGTESVVVPRREGAYMVVERTGRMFTLRNGDTHLCVENTELKKDVIKTASINVGDR